MAFEPNEDGMKYEFLAILMYFTQGLALCEEDKLSFVVKYLYYLGFAFCYSEVINSFLLA